jgi:alanyl-tRNA synthetase
MTLYLALSTPATLNPPLLAALQGGMISGPDAFLLWDTFGFPVDLTQLMAEEHGLSVDAAGFEAAMEEARQKSRAGGRKAGVSLYVERLRMWGAGSACGARADDLLSR